MSNGQYINDGGMWVARVCTRCYRILHSAHDVARCADCGNPEYMLVEAYWRPHAIGGQRWATVAELETAAQEVGT